MATFRQTALRLRYVNYTRPSNVLISRHFTTSVSRHLLSNRKKNTQKQKFTFSNDQQRNQSRLPAFVQTFRRKLLERYDQLKTSDAFYRAGHGTMCSRKNDGTITGKEKYDLKNIIKANTYIVPSDTELQNTIRSILKDTHCILTLQTSKIPTVSVGFRKKYKESDSCVRFTILGRRRKRKSRSKSSCGEILRKYLSIEEQKILKKMIETKVEEEINPTFCENGSNKYRSDSKKERDIDNLSQEIFVNLMAQVLKHALIKHKLYMWTEWIKKRENQKKVLKMLLSLIVFILRFKFLAGLILPLPGVDSLATVDMFSSFTMGSDMKARFKSTSIIDVGQFQDGKSFAFTITTTVEVVLCEKPSSAK